MIFSACKPDIVGSVQPGFTLPPLPRGGRSDGDRYRGTEEPRLSDILQDPVLGRLLASDGVKHDHLLDLIRTTRARLAR